MALKQICGTQNVLEAAKTRIRNVFANGVPVYLSFSSGKDSLCLSHLTCELILAGEIDAKQLTVIFIDEEGLYKSMLEAAYRWRKIFLSVGAKFEWYCLEVKQCSTLNKLENTESWITWEKAKRDVWMREPPPFAITDHPLVPYAGCCNYQTFCSNRTRDGIQIIGLRATESLQRLRTISMTTRQKSNVYPIYDWHDTDVWYYIKEHNLEFPEIYIRLYEAGCSRQRLRLCSFFGDTTVVGLKWVAETDPELWQAIERRYPNAYLVLLYWDSEMFRRQTRQRRQLEGDDNTDYKAKLYDVLFTNTDKYNIPADTDLLVWRSSIKKYSQFFTPQLYKKAYESLLAGDPKKRSLRAIVNAAASNIKAESQTSHSDNAIPPPVDYKAKLYDLLFANTASYNIPADTAPLLSEWRRLIRDFGAYMSDKLFKESYEAILAGDPKKRTFRAIYHHAFDAFAKTNRKEQADRDRFIQTAK